MDENLEHESRNRLQKGDQPGKDEINVSWKGSLLIRNAQRTHRGL